MKKIFFLIFSFCIYVSFLIEPSFAAILSFTTKDGKVFCETDTFDGSYKQCSQQQISGASLVKTATHGPQMMETPRAKICVENGKEVDAKLCNKVIVTSLAPVGTPPSTTGSVTTGVPIVVATGILTPSSVVATSVTILDNYIIIGKEVIYNFQLSYSACIENSGNVACSMQIGTTIESFIKLGAGFIGAFIGIVFVCSIFWLMMLLHALSNDVPYKLFWIITIFLLSFPGAILYSFFVKRPYIRVQKSLLPPSPPSFF